jgi:hypothetical protein
LDCEEAETQMKWVWTVLAVAWGAAGAAQTVTLAWDASPEGEVAGYRIYYGTNSRAYGLVTNAGLVRTQSVVLPHGGRWFFAATAYTTSGVESGFSDEVVWESAPTPPVVAGESWVRLTPLLARSTNLVTWGSVTGAPTWWPATNRAEFFGVSGLLIERVKRVTTP